MLKGPEPFDKSIKDLLLAKKFQVFLLLIYYTGEYNGIQSKINLCLRRREICVKAVSSRPQKYPLVMYLPPFPALPQWPWAVLILWCLVGGIDRTLLVRRLHSPSRILYLLYQRSTFVAMCQSKKRKEIYIRIEDWGRWIFLAAFQPWSSSSSSPWPCSALDSWCDGFLSWRPAGQ